MVKKRRKDKKEKEKMICVNYIMVDFALFGLSLDSSPFTPSTNIYFEFYVFMGSCGYWIVLSS